MPDRVILTIAGAVVRYGETIALDRVSLAVAGGTIHALVGENGAGKSTLLRAVAGATPLDAGTITLAARLRAEWVPQELVLAPDLTVTESVFLGRELRSRARLLQRRAMQTQARAALAALGCEAAPTARIAELSPPVRKQLQLARAFHAAADVLLLDEPTAVLGDDETARLFAAIRAARGRGAAIVYVSHRIAEVLAIADVVTVLRDGQHVSTDPAAAVDARTIVTRMVGRPLTAPRPRRPLPAGERRGSRAGLRVRRLCAARLRDISFEVAAGEIVGVAGLVGAGRSELLECIAGVARPIAGRVETHGSVALVPEDRTRNGLVPTLSLRENVFLPAPRAWLNPRGEQSASEQWIARLRIRAAGTQALPASLSGGNQQKVLVARALQRKPDVLLLDEPTAGVDVGAKADLHEIIRAQADAGAAIVMASSDLPELLTLCDRIVALRNGRQVGTLAIAEATEAHLAALITGAAEPSTRSSLQKVDGR